MTVEELQDEISAIDAIYPDSVKNLAPQIYSFLIPNFEDLEVQLNFPESYPDDIPDVIQVIAHDSVKYSDVNYLESRFITQLNQVYRKGEVCIFELLTELEGILEQYKAREINLQPSTIKDQTPEPEVHSVKTTSLIQETQTKDPLEGWIQSDPVIDRGSTFIGFARKVTSLQEAQDYLDLLVTDKKIAKATHNISAWRIKGTGGAQYQDCDDDGETAAGGRLLHLLTMMDVWDVVVVVSRWFGGTLLGSDRFKHINTAGRNAIMKGNFNATNDVNANNTTGKKRKK